MISVLTEGTEGMEVFTCVCVCVCARARVRTRTRAPVVGSGGGKEGGMIERYLWSLGIHGAWPRIRHLQNTDHSRSLEGEPLASEKALRT